MDQKKKFNSVKFINLSISALGVFDKESATFLKMLEDIHLDKAHTKYITRRLHRRSLRLPTRRKWAKVGGGLDLQIWDLNRAHETERIVFPILQVFSMCRRRL